MRYEELLRRLVQAQSAFLCVPEIAQLRDFVRSPSTPYLELSLAQATEILKQLDAAKLRLDNVHQAREIREEAIFETFKRLRNENE